VSVSLKRLIQKKLFVSNFQQQSQSPGNITVICYFNAGLVQTSDCDYNTTWDTPAYRGLLGRQWPEFPDERWVNIKNGTSHELIKRRIALANRIGCDAVDPDNIDGYGVDSDDELPENEKVPLTRSYPSATQKTITNLLPPP